MRKRHKAPNLDLSNILLNTIIQTLRKQLNKIGDETLSVNMKNTAIQYLWNEKNQRVTIEIIEKNDNATVFFG